MISRSSSSGALRDKKSQTAPTAESGIGSSSGRGCSRSGRATGSNNSGATLTPLIDEQEGKEKVEGSAAARAPRIAFWCDIETLHYKRVSSVASVSACKLRKTSVNCLRGDGKCHYIP